MKKVALFFLFLVTLFISGCDPLREFVINTSGKPNNSITISCNTSLYDYAGNTNELTIHLPAGAKKDTAFNYGIGVWTYENTVELINKIDSIEIVNGKEKLLLKTKQEKYDYLWKHRRGFGGSAIEIGTK